MKNENTKPLRLKIEAKTGYTIRAITLDSGYNMGYIFAGRKVYTHYQPRQYIRLLARLSK